MYGASKTLPEILMKRGPFLLIAFLAAGGMIAILRGKRRSQRGHFTK